MACRPSSPPNRKVPKPIIGITPFVSGAVGTWVGMRFLRVGLWGNDGSIPEPCSPQGRLPPTLPRLRVAVEKSQNPLEGFLDRGIVRFSVEAVPVSRHYHHFMGNAMPSERFRHLDRLRIR